VLKPIKGTVQIYSEVKYGTKAVAEKCRNADSANCGGIGSCVYCQACSGLKNITQKTSGLVQLQSAPGKKLDCERGLEAKTYSDVRINFCMPTKEEFLKQENI